MGRFKFVLLLLIIVMVVPSFVSNAQCAVHADWTNTYTVQRGDTLYRIALRYKLTSTQLAQGNCLSNVNLIYAGQVLRVPGNVTTTPTPQPQPQPQPQVFEVGLTGASAVFYTQQNIYTGVVTIVYQGTVTVKGRSQDMKWVYARTPGGLEGWVITDSVGVSLNMLASLPILTSGSNPNSGFNADINTSGVRLRSGPGLVYYVYRLLSVEPVIVLGQSQDAQWYKIRTADGAEGWAWSAYVKLYNTQSAALTVMS